MDKLGPGFWVDIVWKLWTVGLTFYVAFSRSQKNFEAKIGALERDISSLSLKLTRLDTHIQNAPSHAHLGELHEKINNVWRELARVAAGLESNETLLRTIHSTMIRRGPHE